MSDLLVRRLQAANPVQPDALGELEAKIRDRVLVLPSTAPDRKHRLPRRRLVVIACVLAALLGGPALAFQFGVIDFSTAPAAPHPVVEQFSSLSVGAPPGMDPQVIAGQTRLVGTVLGHQLWVAPTKEGGLCYLWSDSGGGCDAVGGFPLSVTWSGAATTAAQPGAQPGRSFTAVEGFAHSRWVDEVQITLDDGSTVQPEMLWVSPPINAGFFYYRAPPGQAITNVRALHAGSVVAADNYGSGAPQGPHPFADLSRKAEIATIQTDTGSAVLWTAPTETDERCTWLQFQQEEISVVPCLPQGYVHQTGFAFAVHRLGDHQILAGECGYSAIEFIHTDDTTRTVACNDGLVFVDLEPADAAGSLRALDAQGHPLPGSRTTLSGTNVQP
ncbi:MAG TPA: hypothetical protein VMD51_14895 [Mycobacterium sp.]|nr:hypothetical protein [Mycobacterium sp.]